MAPVPRDIYKSDIDFTALALQYPQFAKKSVQSHSRSQVTVLTGRAQVESEPPARLFGPGERAVGE